MKAVLGVGSERYFDSAAVARSGVAFLLLGRSGLRGTGEGARNSVTNIRSRPRPQWYISVIRARSA